MQLHVKVELNLKEKEVIRKVLQQQIRILKKLLHGNCETDIETECLKAGVNRPLLLKSIQKNLMIFKGVYREPENILFALDNDNMSIIKHLMFHYEPEVEGEADAIKRIWERIAMIDALNFYLKPN